MGSDHGVSRCHRRESDRIRRRPPFCTAVQAAEAPTIIFTKLIGRSPSPWGAASPHADRRPHPNGNGPQIAVAYTVAALVASIAYAALFLLLGTGSLHAVSSDSSIALAGTPVRLLSPAPAR